MTEKKDEERKHAPLYDLARRVMLASIGAAVVAQDELENFVDRLVERGEIAEKDARKLMREMADRREKMDKERRQNEQRDEPAAATKADVDTLMSKIAELSRQIEELKKERAK